MSDKDLYWAAGVLEGEGCFTQGAYGSGSNRFRQLVIVCSMTDRDILERLQVILGGTIETKPRIDKRYVNAKPLYRWYITNRIDSERVMNLLKPIMGIRRKARIEELLKYSEENPPRYNTVKHGTRNEYRKGCRCLDCKEANNSYVRDLRKRNKSCKK